MQPYSLAASQPEWSSLKFHIHTKKRWFEKRWYTASVQFFGFLCLYLEDVLVDASSLLPSSKLSFNRSMLRSAQNLYLQTNPWLYLKDTILVCKHILTVEWRYCSPFSPCEGESFPSWTNPTDIPCHVQMAFACYAISLILLMDTTLHPLGGSKTRCCNWVHFLIQYSHHIDWFRIFVHQPYCPVQHFT